MTFQMRHCPVEMGAVWGGVGRGGGRGDDHAH